jgi:hypothetical protein
MNEGYKVYAIVDASGDVSTRAGLPGSRLISGSLRGCKPPVPCNGSVAMLGFDAVQQCQYTFRLNIVGTLLAGRKYEE